MVVEHLKAIEHPLFPQVIHDIDDLRRVQAERAAVAAGLGPVPARARGQLGADADPRLDAHALGPLQHERNFVRHFQDDDRLDAHLQRLQGEVEELLVLVAVADDVRLRVVHERQRRDQLRLAARLQTVVVRPAAGDHLFHDLLLLVDLDGIHAAVRRLVAGVAHRLAEARVDQRDAGSQDVAEAEKHGHVHAARIQAGNNIHQAEHRFAALALRPDHDLAAL